MKNALKSVILLLVITVATMGRLLASEVRREQGPELGKLSLGMTLNEAQRIFGASGFPGVLDDLAETTGRSFIDPSGSTVAGLVFNRRTGKLVAIDLLSKPTDLHLWEKAADSLGFKDWRAQSEFCDWSAYQGFGLGDSYKTVFRACGIEPIEGSEFIQSLLVEYGDPNEVSGPDINPLRSAGDVQVKGLMQKLGTEGNGESYLVVRGKSHTDPHVLTVDFEEGSVVSIRLRLST